MVIEVGISWKPICDFLLVISLISYLVPFQSYRCLLFKFWTPWTGRRGRENENALQLCRWQFHTKKLCSRLSSSEVGFCDGKRPFCVFEPPFEGLGATYNDHFRLIGKCILDFLLVLIELLSLDVTAEVLRVNIRLKIDDFAPTRSLWSKISGRRGRLHQLFLHG